MKLDWFSLFLWCVLAVVAFLLFLRILRVFELVFSRLWFMRRLKRQAKRKGLSVRRLRPPILSLFFVYEGEDFIIRREEEILYKVKFFPRSTVHRVLSLQSDKRYLTQKKTTLILRPGLALPDRRTIHIEPHSTHSKRYSSAFSQKEGQNVILFHPEPMEIIDAANGRGEALGHGAAFADFTIFTPKGLFHAEL